MAAVLLAAGQTMTPVVALTAATYLVKGTNSAFNQIPDSAYPEFAQTYDSAVGVPTPPPIILVPYPATFRPFTPPGYIFSPTFDQSVATGVQNLKILRPVSTPASADVIWGYSQGATVATLYKRDYNAQLNPPATAPTFVLVANPNRPNGGILERGVALGTIPILGLTFSGATPTNTEGQPANTVTTYDIARQYEAISDAPVNPLNPVADLNAIMGFSYLHGQYPNADPKTAVYQGQYGDTEYYLIPTYPLPLLMPLASIPVIGFPLADTLDPPLRVIVESAYDRNTSPGEPTPFNLLYFPNPVTFGSNLLIAIPTGLDNGISDFTGSRPFGTIRPGPYGVGGLPTVGIDGQPTPPLSTPTPGTTPTIPVLFSSSTSDTTTSPPPTTSDATDSAQQSAPNISVTNAREASVANAAPQPSNDNQSRNTNAGPRPNVLRFSLGAADSQQGAPSTNGPQSTKNPIGSAAAGVTKSITGVTKSIRSALGGLSNAAAKGTK